LVVGIGNADRGDDAAGLAVAARLRRVSARDFDVVQDGGDVGRLLDWFATYDEIHVVDALCDGAPDGRVRRWDALAGALPANLSGTSSHVLGLAQAIELGRALGRLPRKLVVHGVPGRGFRMGDAMSAEALRAVDDAVAAIAAELGTKECAGA
jgi:hydrogenase maturation protease